MRILILNYEFPPLGGGASPVSYELAKGYILRGYFVTVITMGYGDLPRYEEKDGIHIYRVSCFRSKKEVCRTYEMFSYIVSAIFFLQKHLKKYSYDINHTHFLIPTGIIALWVKKKFGIDYIITSHGSDVPGHNPDRFTFQHRFTKPLLRRITNSAKVVISPSKFLGKSILENIGNCNIKVIPNGIYIDKFVPAIKKKVILSTGRLLEFKGFQNLIKAVSKMDIPYEVHIAGDGPMMGELKRLALISKTKIIFHGWMDNNSSEYKQLLETASVYVLVSEKENASVALLEAMSAGCAVITSNAAGCPETVGDVGVVVEPCNIIQLKQALKDVIGNEDGYGNKARDRVARYFDWNKIIQHYEKALKS